MDQLIEMILGFLQEVFYFPQIVVILISILPIVEARLAVPIAMEYGFSWFESWGFAFLGSTLIAPLLLLLGGLQALNFLKKSARLLWISSRKNRNP